MCKIRLAICTILVIYVSVLTGADAHAISKVEDSLNYTKPPATDLKKLRSFDSSDCYLDNSNCRSCVARISCYYCDESSLCLELPNSFVKCPSEDTHLVTCPSDGLYPYSVDTTIIYVAVIVGCILLIIKGILLYCFLKRRRTMKSGTVLVYEPHPVPTTVGSNMETIGRNQGSPALTGIASAEKIPTSSPPPYQRF